MSGNAVAILPSNQSRNVSPIIPAYNEGGLDMPPRLSKHDATDTCLGYAEAPRQSSLCRARGVERPNLGNCGGCQSVLPVPLAGNPFNLAAPFVPHVSVIVRNRANEEVGGIDAEPIVTGVADAGVIGERPVVKFKADTVGANASVEDVKHAVAAGVLGAGPYPAPLGFADLLPEAGNRLRAILMSHAKPPIWCAAPRAVTSSAEAFAYHHYSTTVLEVAN